MEVGFVDADELGLLNLSEQIHVEHSEQWCYVGNIGIRPLAKNDTLTSSNLSFSISVTCWQPMHGGSL